MSRGVATVRNNPPVRRGFAVKQQIVEDFVQRFANARLVIVVGYFGINGPKAVEVRRRVAQLGGRYHVVKNTLTRRALVASARPDLAPFVGGPCAVIVTDGEPDPLLCGFDDYLRREQPMRTPRKLRQEPNVRRSYDLHPAGFTGTGVRTNKNEMDIVAVWRDGYVLSNEELELLIEARGISGLRAALLGTLQAPATGLASLLGTLPRGLLSVLAQRAVPSP